MSAINSPMRDFPSHGKSGHDEPGRGAQPPDRNPIAARFESIAGGAPTHRTADTDTLRTGDPRSGMSAEILSLPDAARHAVEWNELAGRSVEQNPFARPDFLLPVASYLNPSNPRILFIRRQGRLTAMLPLVKDKVGFGICGAKDALFFHQYGPVGAPLIDREHVDETVSALFSPPARSVPGDPDSATRLPARRTGLPRGLLVHLDRNGPIYQALESQAAQNGLSPIILSKFDRASLDATQDREHFLRHALIRKKRKDLSRLFRRLEEQGTVRVHAHKDSAAIACALERFMALEVRSWKGEQETALGSETARMQLAHGIVTEFAAAGRARFDEITVDGILVASLISFIDCGRLFTWKIAHHKDFARFSLGSQVVLALTKSILDDTAIQSADSLATPNHPMIDHIWRERISMVNAYFPLRRTGPLAAACMCADDKMHQLARRTAKRVLASAKSYLRKP